MPSANPFALAETAAEALAAATRPRHDVAVVLGSGLGAFADRLDDPIAVDSVELPGFPAPTVPGHAGRVVSALVNGKPTLVFSGRSHLYEGHSADVVVHPVRVAAAVGAHTLVLTNAAGSLTPRLRPGQLVCIADHLNLTGANPLTGDLAGAPEGTSRFVDMSAAYDPDLGVAARSVRPGMDSAVYAALPGPSYETPAEVLMLSRFAGLVGMSTVLETIAARHLGLRVAAFSLVTNMAAGLSDDPLSHAEVTAAGAAAAAGTVEFLADFVSLAHR